MKKFYFTYEIYVNDCNSSLNGCYYYGKHTTTNIDDNYYGSSIILKKYIKKHGISKLLKTIIQFYSNEDELNLAEKTLIEIKKVELNKKCLNLNAGGNGSFMYINTVYKQKQSKEQRSLQARSAALAKNNVSEERKIQRSNNFKLMHKNMSKAEKNKRYTKVSASLKDYYATDVGQIEFEARKEKNKQTNKQTSKKWRIEFFELFGTTPEAFRKFGKLKDACALFKKIQLLTKQEQIYEINCFMESIKTN